MQAVILAGGASSRFYPFNNASKALIKIAGEPIIAHTIRAIKRAGINDVVFLTGHENYFKDALGNGKKFGVKISYASIPEPTGMGDGLLICSKFIKSDFFLVNPQHVEFDELKRVIDDKRGTNQDAILLARENPQKGKYGVLKIDGDRVLSVVEKPKIHEGLSNLRVIGVYFLNQEFTSVLKKVKREHYSFEKALDVFAKQGKVRVAITESEVLTLKYPWDLLGVKNFILGKLSRSISRKAKISKSADIQGNVVIEEGAEVIENAVIKGPAYIGRNVFIGSNTLIRNGSDIEEEAKIGAYMEVKNSLIGEGSKTHSGFIGDSVVGSNTRIGALFGTANVRLDRNSVTSEARGEKIDTGLRSFGAIIGSGVTIGERVSTMPGVIIGNNTVIGPSTTVMKNVPEDMIFYTKFQEIIQKNKPASSKLTSRGRTARK